MILAEVSSGRSLVATLSSTKVERPGSAAARDRSRPAPRRRRLGRLEGGGADGDDLLRVGRLHRLDGVAGIDRAPERVGRDHLDDVGDLHHVEQRGDARHDVLAGGGGRRDERVVGAGERDDQRGERLGEAVLERVGFGEQHLGDAGELRRLGGDRLRRPCRRPAHGRRRRASARRTAPWRSRRSGAGCRARRGGEWSSSYLLEDAGFVLQLVDELGDGGDLDAGLPLRRLARLQRLRAAASRRRRNRRRSSRRSASSSPS